MQPLSLAFVQNREFKISVQISGYLFEYYGNADIYPTGKYVTKQIIDLDIRVTLKEYHAEIYRSHMTDRRIHAAFPKGNANEFNYKKAGNRSK